MNVNKNMIVVRSYMRRKLYVESVTNELTCLISSFGPNCIGILKFSREMNQWGSLEAATRIDLIDDWIIYIHEKFLFCCVRVVGDRVIYILIHRPFVILFSADISVCVCVGECGDACVYVCASVRAYVCVCVCLRACKYVCMCLRECVYV